jgi:hypothetical protein
VSYLLLEDEGRIELEDASGFLLLEQQGAAAQQYWNRVALVLGIGL